MHTILVEGNGIGDLDGHPPNLDLDTSGTKHCHELLVKIGHRPRRQWECLHNSIVSIKHKLMPYKIEPELECSSAVWDSRSSQAPSSYVQRDIPPMVYQRRQPQPNLTDHLSP